jgi:hypothetical protein
MSDTKQPEQQPSRRKFLAAAATGTAGAVAAGFPMISVAQSPITMRWQSTWPQKDIFHEYAGDFATRVNDMAGGKPQDRGAAGRRRGQGLRPARRGEQGHARWRPRRAGLLVRQEFGHGAVGLRPGLRHGSEHGARLAQVWRRQADARRDLQGPEHGRASFLYGPMPTQPWAGSRSRSPSRRTSRA